MESGQRFLVVEFPSRQFIFTRFTAAHPLCTIDVILDQVQARPGGAVHPATFLVKGSPWLELRGLLDELERLHGPVQVLRREASGLSWLCHLDFNEKHLGSDGAALQRLQSQFGPPWLHHEQGVCLLRARLPRGADGEALAARLGEALRQTGVEAQVDIITLAPRDDGVWEELLQASSGRAL